MALNIVLLSNLPGGLVLYWESGLATLRLAGVHGTWNAAKFAPIPYHQPVAAVLFGWLARAIKGK